ncbi:MAG: 50S ribosomal protein L9 [Anaerolineaceae bacterium]|nr:50S ribosomal protein L9 [Anaerolineaceae bacterium]
MKVILLADVYNHGVAGEVVAVADGFARNYLIPKKLAAKATAGELRRAAKLSETAATRRAALDNKLNELARQIDGVELLFGRRAANTGKLFGSVTTTDIADALNEKTGIDINRRRISQQALREVGSFDVPVRLGSEISPVLKIVIVREGEEAAYLAAKAAEAAGDTEAAGDAEAVAEVVEAVEVAVETVDAVAEAAPAETGDEPAG